MHAVVSVGLLCVPITHLTDSHPYPAYVLFMSVSRPVIAEKMPEHLVLNVTSALVENIKSIAALVARNWTGRYATCVKECSVE